MADAREALLRKVLDNVAKEQDYHDYEVKVKGLPPTGANFTSQLFHASLSAPNKKEIKMFAKVSVVGEKLRTQVPTQLFEIEAHVYTKLVKIYEKLEKDNGVPEEHRLYFPKYYGGSETFLEEVLVMEDLSVQGYTTYNRLKSIDWEYASKSVEQLAKLHALSIAYQIYYPDDFNEASKVLVRNMPTEDADMQNMMQQMIAKIMAGLSEEKREKLQKFLETNGSMEAWAKYFMPVKRTVLAHSDFRMSNLVHKYDEDGTLRVIVLDYQTTSVGNPCSDLLYFIFTGSDAAFRRDHYQRLVDYYYEQLSLALRRLHVDPEEAYSRKDFDEELEQILDFGLLIGVMMLPMITVDMEHVTQESESLDTMFKMAENVNTLGLRRITEVVDDYVRWGRL